MAEARRGVSPRSWAVHGGDKFAASGGPPGRMVLHDDDGVKLGDVAIEDLDEWYTIRTFGMVMDHEFELVEEDDERYHLWFAGGDGHWMIDAWENSTGAPDVTFDRVDQISFRGTALKHLVTGIREERADTLAAWRQWQDELKHLEP